MTILKQWWRRFAPNPFDAVLKRAAKQNKNRFLLFWNRGLGDIPLGLYAMVSRIRQFVPDAKITFLTRSDLLDGFSLLGGVEAVAEPRWVRGSPAEADPAFARSFDIVIENPDPTYWVKWQLGSLVPKLEWRDEWDALAQKFKLGKGCVGVHVQTETTYGYEKNWPLSSWKELFKRLEGKKILLFGGKPEPEFSEEEIVDLRGKTSLLELLSIIKNSCGAIVVPDSGVLSLAYFIERDFPLKIVSLWADPRQGVLKQNVASPNRELVHIPLIGKGGRVNEISVDEVCLKLQS